MRCSPGVAGAVVAALLACLYAVLPSIMTIVLRRMFTAPNQVPWKHGLLQLRLIDVNGLPCQVLNSAERVQDLNDGKKLQSRRGDVWVVSYVKSGTTWTIGVLASLWDHPTQEYCGSLQKLPDLGWGDDGFGHSFQALNDWPLQEGHRCFKSHWPNRDFHNTTANRKNESSNKYIYVMRNALDQMRSHWNQVWGMGYHYGTEHFPFEGEQGWDLFVRDWIDGNVENGKWFDHVSGWYERSLTDDNVLLVRYEDLLLDPEGSIRTISKFIDNNGSEAAEATLARVKEMTSFEKMKLADENDPALNFVRWLGVIRKKHIRQGGVTTGNSDERLLLTLSKHQMSELEMEYQRTLEPFGMPRTWVFGDRL